MSPERPLNPWVAGEGRRGEDYDRRFVRLAAEGFNVHGEADFVVSLGVSSVLDAGCGTGRVAIELARRGLVVVGCDLDPTMLDTARDKAPGLTFYEADLAELHLEQRFEAVLLAGNVMIFLVPETEQRVLANCARHLVKGGYLVAGFSLRPGKLDLATLDRLAEMAGLTLLDRWASWDRAALRPSSDYAVSLFQRAEEQEE